MLNKKEAEKIIREKIVFGKKYNDFFPVSTLKNLGYVKKTCIKCGNIFWTRNKERKTCGDIKCEGKYSFIGKPIARRRFTYKQAWNRFSKMFEKFGHTTINSYPVVSRWHPDLYFTMASIQGFQPYVINGEVMPPANPLVIPQVCLRFNDIENVGITGSHYTSFVMVGQHAFNNSLTRSYFKEKALEFIDIWLTKGMKIPEEEITYKSDAWVGGRFGGNSLEFFAGGLELGNQVYSQLRITDVGFLEIPSKTIDMGAGLERWAWFSQGTNTSYDVVFPKLIRKMFLKSGFKSLKKEFWEYGGLLNVDEMEQGNSVWELISKKVNESTTKLKEKLLPVRALYSLADHSRTLLFAIKDGALPSNVGGGYNLRYILRRSLSFINKYSLPFSIYDVLEWQKTESSKIFPKLKNIPNLVDIIENEVRKYNKTMKNGRKIVLRYLDKGLSKKDYVLLYESYGITPDIVKRIGEEIGKEIEIPPNFSSLLEMKKTHKKQKEDKELVINHFTEKLFYKNQYATKFKAKVIDVIDDYVILDKTLFYPTSGGQEHDIGVLNDVNVVDVIKVNNAILHKVEDISKFKIGNVINGEIDWERRYSLMKNHTCTHLLNMVCRKILGEHVWQAGAEKTPDMARLDITHYKKLTWDDLKKIELEVNKLIDKNLKVIIKEYSRDEAEKKFGFRIYQGGAVPGKKLRIVKVDGDIEACGGTHLKETKEIKLFKIMSSERIQDGVVRINFKTGKEAIKEIQKIEKELKHLSELWEVPLSDVGITGKKFFEEWKEQRKLIDLLTNDLVKTKIKLAILSEDEIIEVPTNNFGLIKKSLDESKSNVKSMLVALGENVGYGISKDPKKNVKKVLEKYYYTVQGSSTNARGFKRK